MHLQPSLQSSSCFCAAPPRLRSAMGHCPSSTIQSRLQLVAAMACSALRPLQRTHPAPPAAGRLEFTEFLPESSQGVVVQPIGKEGVLIVGTDTQRGISRLDQAWVATLADKLEVSLEGYKAPKPGVGFASGKA